ncbi:hypothetical protein MRX96_032183 [Rhipicephalus microplus]
MAPTGGCRINTSYIFYIYAAASADSFTAYVTDPAGAPCPSRRCGRMYTCPKARPLVIISAALLKRSLPPDCARPCGRDLEEAKNAVQYPACVRRLQGFLRPRKDGSIFNRRRLLAILLCAHTAGPLASEAICACLAPSVAAVRLDFPAKQAEAASGWHTRSSIHSVLSVPPRLRVLLRALVWAFVILQHAAVSRGAGPMRFLYVLLKHHRTSRFVYPKQRGRVNHAGARASIVTRGTTRRRARCQSTLRPGIGCGAAGMKIRDRGFPCGVVMLLYFRAPSAAAGNAQAPVMLARPRARGVTQSLVSSQLLALGDGVYLRPAAAGIGRPLLLRIYILYQRTCLRGMALDLPAAFALLPGLA